MNQEIKRPESLQKRPTSAKKAFSGQIFDVYQWEQELFDGSKAVFEQLKRPDTVIVFPVLPDGRIILIEESQPGKSSVVGAPGGRIDKGEDVLAAAARELLEETGYEAESYQLWSAEQITSKLDWVVYGLVAKGLKKSGGQTLDPGEKISIKTVSFDDFLNFFSAENQREKMITEKILRAKIDPVKMAELRDLFDPKK